MGANEKKNNIEKMIATKAINFDPLERDLVENIIDSLQDDYRDYAFDHRTKQKVIDLCKKEGINIIYKEVYDRFKELDYIEFIPVVFKKAYGQYKLSHNMQINYRDIEESPKDFSWRDRSFYTEKFERKERKENMNRVNNKIAKGVTK